jgi:hypothetical protein
VEGSDEGDSAVEGSDEGDSAVEGSEEHCLSSAKLRSTDSVNPRAVLSRVRPRYRPLLCVTSSLS